MASATPWLPDDALSDSRLVEPIQQCLDAFSSHWLSGTNLAVVGSWQRITLANGQADCGLIKKGSAHHLAIPDSSKFALASSLIGREFTERDVRTDHDRQFLSSLSDHVLDDLAERICGAIGDQPAKIPPPPFAGSKWRLALALHDCESFAWIEASAELLVASRKLLADSPRLPSQPENPQMVLGPLPVTLHATLGSGTASLSEIEGLAVGDVIPLDRPLNEALDITINGHKAAAKSAVLVPSDQHLTLEIERPVSQW